jgi:DNA polymerase III alpha subunit
METIPIFKSHYSIGRSILTLDDENNGENYPDSIIDIIKSNNLKELYLVEDNMSSFLEAYTNTKKYDIKLRYGLRITVTDDILKKDEETKNKGSKFVIFFKTEEGYKKLVKIFSIASKEGFYHYPRIDFKHLKSLWSEKDLLLAIPFYDSFIFNNLLKGFLCAPQTDFTKPTLFIEDNKLPFDSLIKRKVIEYAKENDLETLNVKSIYYKSKKDFKAYLTFRCINIRSTLNKPELEHMSSSEFCVESWKEIK